MNEFSFRTRRRFWERLSTEVFDLLVIGGGIHGAGVARDAALRGLKVALVEKDDFASGTSSRSSKLIHGGLRYLEQAEFGLVRESCRERHILLRIAPHLVWPLPFLLPLYRHSPRPPWMVRAGMMLYQSLSAFRNIGPFRMLRPSEALAEEPSLQPDGLLGAARYWDCQTDDARFCLANVVDAAAHGATCLNHVEAAAIRWTAGGRNEFCVTVRDVLSQSLADIRVRTLVNAGGPWVDRIAARAGLRPPIRLRPTKGVHLVTRRLTRRHALLLQAGRDRRVFFVLPWGDAHSLIGTTDTDFEGDPDCVRAEASDIEYLLEETNTALPSARLGRADVLAAFAGLRPLLQQEGRAPSDVTRRHQLRMGPDGMFSIVGGKYTTYRAVAEEVTNRVCRRLGRRFPPYRTRHEPLAPGFPARLAGGGGHGPSAEDAETVLNTLVARAVDQEMAMTVADVLYRRTPLGYVCRDRRSLATAVAARMQPRLGWTDADQQREISRALSEVL